MTAQSPPLPPHCNYAEKNSLKLTFLYHFLQPTEAFGFSSFLYIINRAICRASDRIVGVAQG